MKENINFVVTNESKIFNQLSNTNNNKELTSFFKESKKSYTLIPNCVLEHITTTTNLSNSEKLYYLLADNLAFINMKQCGLRSYTLSSKGWANRLNCSRSLVFLMQKSLVKKGYFIIHNDKDKSGKNKRNIIIPTLPLQIFNYLDNYFPHKIGDHRAYNPLNECKRSYLDRTKMFIKINYNLLKIIITSEYLKSSEKILWLSFYSRCYKKHMLQKKEKFNNYNHDNLNLSFISSYQAIANQHFCSTKYLSKSIKVLEKLNFIRKINIHIKNNFTAKINNNITDTSNFYHERDNQFLWKITLSLPESHILELEKVSNCFKQPSSNKKLLKNNHTLKPELNENCLIVNGVKFSLNSEQSSFLLNSFIKNNYLSTNGTDYLKNLPNTSNKIKELEPCKEERDNPIINPTFAKSGLLLNKELKLKEYIKSNLEENQKVFFNNFSEKHNNKDQIKNEVDKKNKEFNIVSELIRKKIKTLPKDKADKARKFAYSLVSKRLATGYAASLSKSELAKQLIYHAASWKPTKLGPLTKDKEIDTALAVAWKAIISGKWRIPLQYAKAQMLQYEYNYYQQKYQYHKILSNEISTLQVEVNKLLKESTNLLKEIISQSLEHHRSELTSINKETDKYMIKEKANLEENYSKVSIQSNLLEIENKYDLNEKDEKNETYAFSSIGNTLTNYLKKLNKF